MRLVLANARTANYRTGGGHLSVRLQYMLALQELNIDWHFIQLMRASQDVADDEQRIGLFFKRLRRYGLADRTVVLRYEGTMSLASSTAYGMSMSAAKRIVAQADVAWNFCCSLRDPLLSAFKRTALLDLDPGLIHYSALEHAELGIGTEHARFTVGLAINDEESPTPKHGLTWTPFLPPIYLPLWDATVLPRQDAPFTTVTHWTWGDQMPVGDRLVSTSKRDAYLRYLELPERVDQDFELAVLLGPKNPDQDTLRAHGWRTVNSREVARSPALYRSYICSSRAELCCPKPIFRELRTGWFSDRSAAYLASGRPVLAEDTGFSRHLPTGMGLLSFTNMEEAVDGVNAINADYRLHAKSAREFAEEYLDATKVINAMLDVS